MFWDGAGRGGLGGAPSPTTRCVSKSLGGLELDLSSDFWIGQKPSTASATD